MKKRLAVIGLASTVTAIGTIITETTPVFADEETQVLSPEITDSTSHDTSSQKTSLINQIEIVEQKISEIQSEVDSSSSNLAINEELLATKSDEKSDLADTISSEKTILENTQAEIKTVTEQIIGAERTIEGLEAKVEELQKSTIAESEALRMAQEEQIQASKSVETIQRNVAAAEGIVSSLESELADEKKLISQNEASKTELSLEINKVTSELKKAETNLEELDKKYKTLQDDVRKAESQTVTEIKTTEILKGVNWQQYFENVKLTKYFSPRETFNYAVEGTEGITAVTKIVISEADKNAIENGTYLYTPNATKVSEHYAAYINKLRALNGIDTQILGTNTEVTAIAEKHVTEYVKKSEEWRLQQDKDSDLYKYGKQAYHFHESFDPITGKKVWWNNSDNFAVPNTNLYYNGSNITDTLRERDGDKVFSDQELAYRILLKEFSEYIEGSRYATIDQIYGHRMYLLLMDTDYVGVAAVRDPQGDIRTTEIFMNDNSDGKGKETNTYMTRYQNANNPGLVSLDANGNFLYNGNRVSFLPATQFSYVTEEIITNDSALIKAKNALSEFKNSKILEDANTEISNLNSQLTKLNDELNKLNQYVSNVTNIEENLSLAKITLEDNKLKLNQAIIVLENAINKVNDLSVSNVDATVVEQLNQAREDLLNLESTLLILNTKVNTLQISIAEAELKRESLCEEITNLELDIDKQQSNLSNLVSQLNSLSAERDILQEKLKFILEIEILSEKNKVTILDDGTIIAVPKDLTNESPTHSLPEAKIELKEVAFETVYENDPTLDLGKEVVLREGQNGSVQVITIGDQVTEIVLTEKVDKLVKRGILVK
ncbi:TPA: G5 domain-containing protein, partial [Streptococcus suis]